MNASKKKAVSGGKRKRPRMSSRRANDYEPEIVNDDSVEPSVDELAPRFGMGDISGVSSKAKIH